MSFLRDYSCGQRHGRSTTVYLLSGLATPGAPGGVAQTPAVGPNGLLPRLPDAQLALALLADRIRTTIGQAGAVFRLHPAGSTVPVMVISGGAIAFLVLSTSPSGSCTPRRPPRVVGRGHVTRGLGRRDPAHHRDVAGPAAGLGGGPGQGSDSSQLTQPGSGDLGGSSLARSLPRPGRAVVARATARAPAAETAAADPAAAGLAAAGPAAARRQRRRDDPSAGADPTPT